jgi:hypothetical protein
MTKFIFLFIFLFTVSCSSSLKQQVRQYQEDRSYVIHWPAEYEPEKSSFFVHNEIFIEAPAQIIWNILIQAETWPQWYEGASNVEIINSENSFLEEHSVFKWKTMGLNFESTITEFDPPYRLSWESKKKIIRGYHAWLIIPAENGCRVITDESQNGFLTFLEKIFQPNKLRKLHDIWLLEIKKKAELAHRSDVI